MTAALHLARRYLRQHPLQTALLAVTLGLLIALPLVLRLLLREAENQLHARAAATPLVLGARASALDLALGALHFRLPGPPVITQGDIKTLTAAAGGDAQVIPLHLRFQAQSAPVVGTDLEYFAARGLTPAQGTLFQRLGDCVLGARLAERRGLAPGASLVTTPEQAFNLAGSYPLKMRVTGVLHPTGSADDDAVFVDLKTAWLIEGLAHGHDDLAAAPGDQLLSASADNLVANASVPLYNEVTSANLGGFHFHGDPDHFPVSAALVFPRNAKADALLSGRYQKHPSLQLIAPASLIQSLMDSLFRLEGMLHLLLAVTGAGVVLVTALVFALTYRLRQREFQTLADLGVAPRSLAAVKLLEILLVLALAAALATAAVTVTWLAAPELLRRALGG